MKLTIQQQLEKIKDIEQGVYGQEQKTYSEIVEEMNKDLKAIEYAQSPI
jgi:hypothetical protein